MARMDQGRRAREGVDGQGTVNNSVIVPEELTRGVIAGRARAGPGGAPEAATPPPGLAASPAGRHITDFRRQNQDETDVIMAKIREKWGEPPEEKDI